MNVDTGKGMVNLVKNVLKVTLCFEVAGAILSFICFSKRYDPLKALGVSVFHSSPPLITPALTIWETSKI